MIISPATTADIPSLCELLNELFSQEAEFKPNYSNQYRGLAQIIANPEIGGILVARQENKVLGMVNLLYTVSTALGARVALLEDMVVAPAARNSGIGTKLIQQGIEFAKLNGCRRITLLTDRSNLSAQSFYAKHGFKASDMLPLRLQLD